MAELQLFPHPGYEGGAFIVRDDNINLSGGFNDVASSAIVISGTFTLYMHPNFTGDAITVCKTGGPNSDGRYPHPESLGGKNDAVSSVKKNSDHPM